MNINIITISEWKKIISTKKEFKDLDSLLKYKKIKDTPYKILSNEKIFYGLTLI